MITGPDVQGNRRRRAIQALHVLTVSAFAFAQPLFDLLGRNPSFFVAHRAAPGDVIVLTLSVLLVPPVLLTAVVWSARAVSERTGERVQAAAIGCLAAVALVPPVVRPTGLGWVPAALAGGVVFAAAGLAYGRSSVARRFVTVVSPAVVVFGLLFLFGSPVRDVLIVREDPYVSAGAAEARAAPDDTPVVVALFDELALASLVTPEGGIDEVRYPNFARLARTSTWYREATTVALRTDQAVPAILTGRRPDRREVPTSHAYPQNLFTLLAPSHELQVEEFVTQLCPPSLCGDRQETTSGLATLLADAAVVYLHVVTPPDLAARALPPLGDRWAGFAGGGGQGGGAAGDDPVRSWLRSAIEARETQHEADVLDRFLDGLGRRTGRPPLSYVHLQVPHPPWRYLPDGRTYPTGPDTPGYRNFRWGPDQYLATEVHQRSLLQTVFADELLGRLLDRLEEEAIADDAMLVVLSDHGATWAAGGTRRETDEINAPALLNVPLFVRYPGQTEARIDDGNAETIDVVPTIADVVGLDVGYETDGSSLLDGPRRRTKTLFDGSEERTIEAGFAGVLRYAGYIREVFGPPGGPDDLFAFGPHAGLMGAAVEGLAVNEPAGANVSFDPDPYADVDHRGRSIPSLFRAEVSGERMRAGIPVAVAVNGRVAGVGQTYISDGATRIALMLSPRHFHDGSNDVAVYVIGDGGALSRLST